MENVTLNQKEQGRLQVLNSLLAKHMTIEQASALMGLSIRHTRRILATYKEEGAAALAHGHRGRESGGGGRGPASVGAAHRTGRRRFRHHRQPRTPGVAANVAVGWGGGGGSGVAARVGDDDYRVACICSFNNLNLW